IEVDRTFGDSYVIRPFVTADLNGAFGTTIELVDDATAATILAELGATADDHPRLGLTDLLWGTTSIAHTFELAAPRLVIEGIALDGGEPYVRDFPVRVEALAPASVDDYVVTTTITPDDTGHYELVVVLPTDTTD